MLKLEGSTYLTKQDLEASGNTLLAYLFPSPDLSSLPKSSCAPLSLMPLTTATWQSKETLPRPKDSRGQGARREKSGVTPKWPLGVPALLGIRASGWFWLHGCNLVRGSEGRVDWGLD